MVQKIGGLQLKVKAIPGGAPSFSADNLPADQRVAANDSLGNVLSDYFNASSTSIPAATISIGGFVTIGGDIRLAKNGTQIQVLATNVFARLTNQAPQSNQGFSVEVRGGKLALLLNNDGTRVVYARGTFELVGGEFAAASGIVTVMQNTTGADFLSVEVSDPVVTSLKVTIPDLPAGAASVSGTGLSFDILGFVSLSGDFGFAKNGNQIKVVASNVSATLKASKTSNVGVRVSGAQLGMVLNNDSSSSYLFAASGTASLLGLPANVSLAGSLKVELNNTPADFDGSIDVDAVSVAVNVKQGVKRFGGGADLTILGQVLQGTFAFETNGTDIEVAAEISNLELKAGSGVNAKRLLQLSGMGALLINDKGVAAQFGLTLVQGPEIPGLLVSGSFVLKINTTGAAVTQIAGQGVDLKKGPFFLVAVEGTLSMGDRTLAGGFGFEKSGENIGVAARIDSLPFNPALEITGGGALLITPTGIAFQVSASVKPSAENPKFTGAATIRFNTTGVSIENIAGTDVQLPIEAGKNLITVTVENLEIQLGNLATFSAADVTLDLTAKGSETLVTFGGDPATGGALTVAFNQSSGVLAGWGGTAGNFAIRADLKFKSLNQFFGSLTIGDSGFGLPSFIPVKVSQAGFEFNDGAIDADGVLQQPTEFTVIVSGEVEANPLFPISGGFEGLRVNVGKLPSSLLNNG